MCGRSSAPWPITAAAGPTCRAAGRAWEEDDWAGRALFWNSGRFLWDMPPDLRRAFEGARLVVIKGDANHRRALGDGVWPDG